MFFFCLGRRSFKVSYDKTPPPRSMLIIFKPMAHDGNVLSYCIQHFFYCGLLSGDTSDFKLVSRSNNTLLFLVWFWTRGTHVGLEYLAAISSAQGMMVVEISTRGSCDPAGFVWYDRPGRFVGHVIYIHSG